MSYRSSQGEETEKRMAEEQQVIDPSLESIHHVPHRTDATASAKDNVQHSLQLTTVYYYTLLEPSSSSSFPSINKNTTVTLLFAFSFCAGQTLFSLFFSLHPPHSPTITVLDDGD